MQSDERELWRAAFAAVVTRGPGDFKYDAMHTANSAVLALRLLRIEKGEHVGRPYGPTRPPPR